MKKKHLLKSLLTVIALCIGIHAHAQNWTKKADLPEGREGALCFSLNGKVYWGGGTSTSQNQAKGDLHEYDPTTDTWTAKANMPEERSYGISFSINGKGYIGLGRKSGSLSTAFMDDLYEYDASTDKWTKKASIPTGFGMLDSRVFVVNNKAYVLGGTNSNFANYGTLYEYDPASDAWTLKAPYPVTNQGNNWVRMPFTFAIGSKGYVVGGEVRKASGLGSDYSKETYEYDPASDTWTKKADFTGDGRLGGTAFVSNGKGYCVLGTSKDANFMNVFYQDAYTYDPTTDKWTKIADYTGAARLHATAAVVDGVAYVGGGSEWQTGYKTDWYSIGTPNSINTIQETQSNVSVYPNPVRNVMHIQSDSKFSTYSLYNMLGQAALNGPVNSTNTIDVSVVPVGNYILELQSENTQARQLVTIE